MNISTLVIGRSLTIPFAINLEGTEKPRQREPELAPIDFPYFRSLRVSSAAASKLRGASPQTSHNN